MSENSARRSTSLIKHFHDGFFGPFLTQVKLNLNPLRAHLCKYNIIDNPFLSLLRRPKLILLNTHHHHHLFLKTSISSTARSARVRRLPRYEASSHILEHCPIRVKTCKLVRVFFYTFSPCLPTSAQVLTPATTKFLQADTQSSPFLRSTCPNHLNLPRLTTYATLWTPKRLYKASLRFLSFRDTPHIHLTIMRSALSRLCRFSTLKKILYMLEQCTLHILTVDYLRGIKYCILYSLYFYFSASHHDKFSFSYSI